MDHEQTRQTPLVTDGHECVEPPTVTEDQEVE